MMRNILLSKKIGVFLIVFAALVFGINLDTLGQTTLAAWNFPNNPDNATADGGIAANTAKTITLINSDASNALNFSRSG